jgi:hypothetical protein
MAAIGFDTCDKEHRTLNQRLLIDLSAGRGGQRWAKTARPPVAEKPRSTAFRQIETRAILSISFPVRASKPPLSSNDKQTGYSPAAPPRQ